MHIRGLQNEKVGEDRGQTTSQVSILTSSIRASREMSYPKHTNKKELTSDSQTLCYAFSVSIRLHLLQPTHSSARSPYSKESAVARTPKLGCLAPRRKHYSKKNFTYLTSPQHFIFRPSEKPAYPALPLQTLTSTCSDYL